MFEGISTAIITPFRDGDIDESALRTLIERQIDAGVNGLVPCGSTGESATMSHQEHARVIEITVSAVGGRVAVLAGTGSNNTREAIDLTQRAKDAGADGALLISPYYNRPTQDGIYEHYKAIAEQTEFPLVVYNVPGRTGSNILPGTLARLAGIDHVVGVKEACGDIGQIAEVIDQCPDGFAILSGDDSLTLPLVAGGKPIGVVFFSSRQKDTYNDQHASLLRRLAGHIAISIEKTQLIMQLQHRNKDLDEINQIKDRFLEKLKQEVDSQTGDLRKSEQRNRLLVTLGHIINSSLDLKQVFEHAERRFAYDGCQVPF